MEAATVEAPAEMRERWECCGCGVVFRNAKAALIPPPGGWTNGRCLSCHRDHLLQGNRGKGGDRSDLFAFELRRGTPLSTAAMRAHTNITQARKLQKAMLDAGELEPSPRKVARQTREQIRAERMASELAVLQQSGPLTVTAFADECGLPRRTAKKHLSNLKAAGKAVQGEKRPNTKARLWTVS